MMIGRLAARLAAVPAAVLVLITVVVPVAGLALGHLEAGDLVSVWSRPGVMDAVWFSVWQAAVSTAATVAIGLAPTWIVTRYRFPGRAMVRALLTAPFVLPTVVVGAAFLALLPPAIDRSVWAIVAAHVFFNIAVVVRTVGPTWSLLDEDLLMAARTLGASPRQVWRHVLVPMAAPALRASAGLIFLLCATSFGVVRILGGPSRATVDVEIYRRAVQVGDTSGATVLAIVQTLVICLALGIARTPPVSPVAVRSPSSPALSAPWRERWTAYGFAALMSLPVLALVLASVRANGQWTWRAWRVLFGVEAVDRFPVNIAPVIVTSLYFAALAASIAVPLGIAAARAMVRADTAAASPATRRFASSIAAISTLPLGTSAVVVGLGILVTYDRDPFDVRSAWWLVPLVHAAIAVPFVVRIAAPVLQSIPDDLRHAAATLGASPWRRLTSVELPLMRPAITSSVALSGALSLGEFGATSFLTRRDTETLPITIGRLIGRAGSLSFTTAMAAATLLLVVTMAVAALAETGTRR